MTQMYFDWIVGNVAQYVSGVAWHGYYGRHDAPEAFHNKHQHVGMYFFKLGHKIRFRCATTFVQIFASSDRRAKLNM
jgi:hypothetical protein